MPHNRNPLRVFIGFDAREVVAYHVLCASILEHASHPVSFTPLVRPQLSPDFTRARGPLDSTDFSLSRFIVPYLAGYQGLAVFLDCDMLCRADIYELLAYPLAFPHQAVFVAQHDYVPASATKFLGQTQTAYPRKNWSSVMLFNAAKCRSLTPSYIHSASAADLHRFAWLDDADIGGLPREWNHLVGEENQSYEPPKLCHWTNGGPWFHEYRHVPFSDEWRAARDRMLGVAVQLEVTA